MRPHRPVLRIISLIGITTWLIACGGGGGGDSGGDVSDDGGSGVEPPTFDLSGFISSAITDTSVSSVSVTLSGAGSATTFTDGTGQYSFSGLDNGSYFVTPSFTNAEFNPIVRPVTINGAGITNSNFLAFRSSLVASGIDFLPQSFLSSEQLRVSLIVDNGDAIFTDSSDFPLKKQPLDGSPTITLARRFLGAEGVTIHGVDVYWIEGGNLHRTTPAGVTTVLIQGQGGPNTDATADIAVDDTYAYWVDTVPSLSCSPPCTWVIQKVPLGGGTVETLATVDRLVVSLVVDADTIFWEESSQEPLDPGCNCGSKIMAMPKAGGPPVVLVDGTLNGTLPPVPPGSTPASWLPSGGIAITDTDIIFAVVANSSYQMKSVPVSGGSINDFATVPSNAGFARNSLLDISVSSVNAYWIDTGNSTINSMSLQNGAITALVNGLDRPSGLAINASTAYWTESGGYIGCCIQMGTGSIKQIPLSGGAVTTVVGGLDLPNTLSLSATELAWSELWRVAKVPIAIGPTTTVISGIESNLARIAVAQGNVYILDGDLIKVVPLNGGTVEKMASARLGSIGDFSRKNGDIIADNTSIYWTVRGVLGAPIVQKIEFSGGVPAILANEPNLPNPQDCYWRIAVDEQNVYWSEGSMTHPVGCAVRKVPVNGGAVTTVFDERYVTDFTVDGINVYFSEFEGIPSIRKIPIDGGTITIVADNAAALVLVNVLDKLYWIGFSFEMGMISTSPGTSTFDWTLFPYGVAVDPFLAFEDLFIDSSGLYVSETQTGNIYTIY